MILIYFFKILQKCKISRDKHYNSLTKVTNWYILFKNKYKLCTQGEEKICLKT